MPNQQPRLELTPSMGTAVLAHLAALGKLPDTGYLAGESVSSALFELFADNRDPISMPSLPTDVGPWRVR